MGGTKAKADAQERADLLRRLSHWCLPCPVLSVSNRRSNGEPANRQCVAPVMKGANPLPLSSSLGNGTPRPHWVLVAGVIRPRAAGAGPSADALSPNDEGDR